MSLLTSESGYASTCSWSDEGEKMSLLIRLHGKGVVRGFMTDNSHKYFLLREESRKPPWHVSDQRAGPMRLFFVDCCPGYLLVVRLAPSCP